MAQNVTVAGASYTDVPSVELPKTGGGTASFRDTSDATAAQANVQLGYSAYGASGKLNGTGASTITGTYTANTKTLAISTSNITAAWFGAHNMEFLYEAQWSKKLNEASNWSTLTPSTTDQKLTWVTSYTSTAAANATFDRYGSGYHSGTAMDYGVYNYIWLCDAFIKYVYTTDESTLGMTHVFQSAAVSAMHWGARPRTSSGSIIVPSTTTYGAYANVNIACNMTLYRTAANVQTLTNNSTYGVGLALVAPSMNSTSTRTPSYFNLRTPTVSIRGHDTYMKVAAFNYLDADKTTANMRIRIYRVPVADGLYTYENMRLLDMMQSCAFPAEVI